MPKGLNELNKYFENLTQNAENLEGTHTVGFDEIFNDSFMQAHTNFSSLESLLKSENISHTNFESLLENEDEALDKLIQKHSSFQSWTAFQEKAVTDLVSRELFK